MIDSCAVAVQPSSPDGNTQNRRYTTTTSQIPEDILNNEAIQQAIKLAFPSNYDFEIEKSIWRIRQAGASHVMLQLPEGLTMYGESLAAVLEEFTTARVTVLGDVTYGACCIDDITAHAIGADFLIHYGHSCLVPLNQTPRVTCLYVFVIIDFDHGHLADSILRNYPVNGEWGKCIALMGTIQYSTTLHRAKRLLEKEYGPDGICIPQKTPLTSGEVLGCTSPILNASAQAAAQGGCSCSTAKLKDIEETTAAVPTTPPVDLCVFVADGRFHLESAMIQNPEVPFVRYDPFTKKLLREMYNHGELMQNRQLAIAEARRARTVCLCLGTLGRQGSVGIMETIKDMLEAHSIKYYLLLTSELSPKRLERLGATTDAFVQVACPRLSLDWGHQFPKPLLTPYEAFVAYGDVPFKTVYPMDFYSSSGGPWSNYGVQRRMGSITPDISPADRRALIARKLAEKRKMRAS